MEAKELSLNVNSWAHDAGHCLVKQTMNKGGGGASPSRGIAEYESAYRLLEANIESLHF